MRHPILQLAKTTCGSRAARARRDYKLSSIGASHLASLESTVTVGHFQNENVRRMVYASYQLILDFETKAEYQVEYDVLKAKQRTQAKTISLSSLGSGAVVPTVGRIKDARVAIALNQGVFSRYFVLLKSNPVTNSCLDENSSLLYS